MDVNTKGLPKAIALYRSSGNACVDGIAIVSAKKLRFLPPLKDGKPTVSHTVIKVDF
jgi:outer membrane biosynthesis protein TonB